MGGNPNVPKPKAPSTWVSAYRFHFAFSCVCFSDPPRSKTVVISSSSPESETASACLITRARLQQKSLLKISSVNFRQIYEYMRVQFFSVFLVSENQGSDCDSARAVVSWINYAGGFKCACPSMMGQTSKTRMGACFWVNSCHLEGFSSALYANPAKGAYRSRS